ncbi:MAG: hydroxylamine reductase [Deltaproteobacteria bacterium]|nr:hydroxylamine reductase [Deltaproteobacteria bacterium]
MFCNQCQETMRNEGCTFNKGVCGKANSTANLQDVLLGVLRGIAYRFTAGDSDQNSRSEIDEFVTKALFSTITNVNFSDDFFIENIKTGLELRDQIKIKSETAPLEATWSPKNDSEILQAAAEKTFNLHLQKGNEDLISLKELLLFGIKGIAAYGDHALVLGQKNTEIFDFMYKSLEAISVEEEVPVLLNLVMEAGKVGVEVMALLDKANTKTYGHPEMTQVKIDTGNRPGILISGHDLKDFEELLEQSKDAGVDIYTHGEMLPANSYPFFKKYDHFYGNYGGSWWQQKTEFEKFNGPILMTTNCLVPPAKSYADRLFTTGNVGFDGIKHIVDRKPGSRKDFSEIIEMAKKTDPPAKIEEGTIWGGFARNQVMELADKVIAAVKEGAISKFVVMAGCDGRFKDRSYYTEIAEKLPEDTVILTAGCAKYRYNKLDLGDIGGIPRVLDAGQCNDSYSLAYIALQLKDAFGLDDINDLPISYDIAWYEQKAVLVLLALLHLGVKGIRLGPTLPAFLSPAVVKVLVDKFEIKPIGDVAQDVAAIMNE